ncbi:MAG: cysteine desulfurase [candidate division Zixibacteria bacterium]|nr:cysteine desulfurase [candidate division Zixibacteria bacterium]
MSTTTTVPIRTATPTPPKREVASTREDFPILKRMIHGSPLVYLDSAATTQKPEAVINVLVDYYHQTNANVHRGLYALAAQATDKYEGARAKVAKFIGAGETEEIVFTRNTTESINLVAQSWGTKNLKSGDEILVSEMEHHSNLVPWFMLAKRTGAVVRHIPILDDGTLDLSKWNERFTNRTRLVALTHVSNVLGTINPVPEIAEMVHKHGALLLVDGAQGVPHMPVSVATLGADFVAFSAHKMLGPTGVGVLWGRRELLEAMDPFLGGGDMIRTVSMTAATWNDLPWKFEAGTPNIADVIGFGAAIDYLESIGMTEVRRHEIELTEYALEKMHSVDELEIHGPADPQLRAGVISFNHSDIHPHDLSTYLDRKGVAIRAGHHCAQPLMERLGQTATARASFYVYNNREDIDTLIDALQSAGRFFGRR